MGQAALAVVRPRRNGKSRPTSDGPLPAHSRRRGNSRLLLLMLLRWTNKLRLPFHGAEPDVLLRTFFDKDSAIFVGAKRREALGSLTRTTQVPSGLSRPIPHVRVARSSGVTTGRAGSTKGTSSSIESGLCGLYHRQHGH